MFRKNTNIIMIFLILPVLLIHWDYTLADDRDLTLQDIYEDSSRLAGNLLGATAWGFSSGVQFNKGLSFVGGENYYNGSFKKMNPVYYRNAHCVIYGSLRVSPSAEVETGRVYGIFSMEYKGYKTVELYVVARYFTSPRQLFINCKSNELINSQISVSVFENLLDNVITLFN